MKKYYVAYKFKGPNEEGLGSLIVDTNDDSENIFTEERFLNLTKLASKQLKNTAGVKDTSIIILNVIPLSE